MNFNEGDRVRVVRADSCDGMTLGNEGTILYGGDNVQLDGNHVHPAGGNWVSYFELVTPRGAATPAVYVSNQNYRVKANATHKAGTLTEPVNAALTEGSIVTALSRHSDGDFWVRLVSTNAGPYWISPEFLEAVDSNTTGNPNAQEGDPPAVAALREPAPAVNTDEITQLRADLARAREEHRQDIARISEALTEEANDRGWCEEYDELVEALNDRLHVELETRYKDYEVTIEFRQTITVRAASEDNAMDEARDSSDYGRLYDENETSIEATLED